MQILERLNDMSNIQFCTASDEEDQEDDDSECDDPNTYTFEGNGIKAQLIVEENMDVEETVECAGVHSLVAFCPTRWYSAWSVMVRFLELFDALSALKEECASPLLKKNNGLMFASYMESIHREDLRKTVHYLRPLVQAIDFFQSDMTTHWDVLPVFNALLSFYKSKTGDPQTPVDSASSVLFILPKGAVSDAFSSRMAFFTDEYPALLQLYTDEFARTLPREVDMSDERVICFKRQLFEEIERLCNPKGMGELDGLVNQMQKEAIVFLKLHRKRKGTTMDDFLELHRDEVGMIANKFQELFSLPASSAAVERAFSVQGCFLQPRRNQLSLATVKSLMTIKMNCMLAEKNGWVDTLLSYLQNCAEKSRKK